MIIRKASKYDLAGIAKVHVDTWHDTYKGIISDDYLSSITYQNIGEHLKSLYQDEGKACLIAQEQSGKIVGFATYGTERISQTGITGELYAIYILKEYQRKGFGKHLIKAVVRELIKKGFTSLRVWVLADNPSKYFYEKLGGKQTEKKKIKVGEQMIDEISYGWEGIKIILKLI